MLPMNGFKWRKEKFTFDEDFILNWKKDSDKRYKVKIGVNDLKDLHELHSVILFFPERIKIDICQKQVNNLYSKENYVIHIRALKQALDHEVILEKVQWVIE